MTWTKEFHSSHIFIRPSMLFAAASIPLKYRSSRYRLPLCIAILLLCAVVLSPLAPSYLPNFNPQALRYSPEFIDEISVLPDSLQKDYREWNKLALRELHSCNATRVCGKNQSKVALLAAHWFQEAVLLGFRGGEGIWWAFLLNLCEVQIKDAIGLYL